MYIFFGIDVAGMYDKKSINEISKLRLGQELCVE